MSLPDGSPAAGVGVKIDVPTSTETSWEGETDGEGAVFPVFNIPSGAQITVDVSIPKQLTRCISKRINLFPFNRSLTP